MSEPRSEQISFVVDQALNLFRRKNALGHHLAKVFHVPVDFLLEGDLTLGLPYHIDGIHLGSQVQGQGHDFLDGLGASVGAEDFYQFLAHFVHSTRIGKPMRKLEARS